MEHLGSYIISNDDVLLKEIKNELYACPCYNSDYGDVTTYPIFREKNDVLFVPRFYKTNKIKINKKYNDGTKINIVFTKIMRENQKIIVDKCHEILLKKYGGIINLPCGYGKTVISLYLACLLGVKTLVIVHKTFLQDQWIARIKEFTNAKIGVIRQKKIDIENKDIVVGMLQSVSMIEYKEGLFNDFGLVIYDEAHHIISKVFSNALFKINSKYVIGLTATPQRTGNLTKGIKLHIGDIIYRINKRINDATNVKVINYKSSDKLFVEKKMFIRGQIKPNIQKMINNICLIKDRNKILVDIIYTLWNCEDRQILVLSGRTTKVKHLNMLKEMLDEKINYNILKGNILSNECVTAYYTGKTSQLERQEAEKDADIIFATYDMAHEGLDIPRLNTVVLATSKSSVEQAIGRIMRGVNNNAVSPLIIDIVDEMSTFPNQYIKREKLYMKMEYNIEKYFIDNDKLITKRDYLRMKYKYTDDELDKEFDDEHLDYEPDFEKILRTNKF